LYHLNHQGGLAARTTSWIAACASVLALGIAFIIPANTAAAQNMDEDFFSALEYRNIGPFRGGRSTAIEGVEGQPMTFYFGATGGGLWKTTNGGHTWDNISDDYFGVGSIGSIDVAKGDPNLIIVGTGASPVRGVASSYGDGVYRSTDGGATWTNVGLTGARQIGSVDINPINHDVMFAAAQGSPYAPTEERGVYKSTDGGDTWNQVLYINDTTGAIDIKIDENNPRVMYATMWDTLREPWHIRSGGEGSGIYKSTDGGDTWNELTEGLPDLMGKIGVAVSPANSERVWAIVEATDVGGLYRSDDGGESWELVNGDHRMHSRSWYYMHIVADPNNENTVYVMNSGMYKSIDGGRTISAIRGVHGDFHWLWINPDDSNILASANDGGGAISFDGGQTWSSEHNQPTAQFYRVNVDNQFPYRVYGGQQDNSSVAVRSRGLDGRIGIDDYFAIGGCESAHVAFDPDDPRYVYAGCYLGLISEVDVETGISRDVRAYPELAFGVPARDRKYRYNWNAPIVTSPHDRSVIYHGAQVLLRSDDRGQSWTAISPDLTRNEDDKQGDMGGPITNEVTENYNTLFAVVESPHEAGTIWTGSDDGLVHITRNGGEDWNDVTPRNTPPGMVNSIEVSPHNPGKAYVAYTGYKYNDFTPVIYRTENYGSRWRNIASGIPEGAFVRVVREDPVREGLLYAGTETGMYISFNDGRDWQKFQQNLPIVPITDIMVHGDDLVLSTQGRAFWILDNLTPLRTISDDTNSEAVHVFRPVPGFDFIEGLRSANGGDVANPDDGAWIYYSLANELGEDDSISLEIFDADGNLVNSYDGDDLDAERGLNLFVWDLQREGFTGIDGDWTVFGNDEIFGFQAVPGTYSVRVSVGDNVAEQPLVVTQDPRSTTSDDAFADQQEMLWTLYNMGDELHRSINALRVASAQAKDLIGRDELGLDEALVEAGEAFGEAVKAWDDSIFSSERAYFQDVLNWPDRLDAELLNFYGTVAGALPPLSPGIHERFEVVTGHWDEAMSERDRIVAEELAAFNAAYADQGLAAIILDPFVDQGEDADD
jgi:photosystem II stability/assembly factor-like uncharacterized protein